MPSPAPPSASSPSPLVRFGDAGTAMLLSYNVPEPVAYYLSHLVEIEVPTRWFKHQRPPGDVSDVTLAQVSAAMLDGFRDRRLFAGVPAGFRFLLGGTREGLHHRILLNGAELPVPNLLVPPDVDILEHRFPANPPHFSTPRVEYEVKLSFAEAEPVVTEELALLAPEAVFKQLQAGRFLKVVYDEGARTYRHRFVDLLDSRPRIAIQEVYRLASYLSDYGAGRALSTFSLLPGEKTRIAVKSWRKATSVRQETSSIFDAHTQEAAEDFQRAAQLEETDKQNHDRRDEWKIELEGQVNAGYAAVKMGAGYGGSAASAREQFAKNVSNAATKTSARASNKRDIKIEQRSDTRTESDYQSGEEREIQNINTGQTLNFVFRQMNQAFLSVLHLVDARVAYQDADLDGSLRVVALPELDRLLDAVLAPEHAAEARTAIVGLVRTALENVFDHEGKRRSLVREGKLGDGTSRYLYVDRTLTAEVDGGVQVPGIVVHVQRSVMRTDGVIVEALLGQSVGLDDYARGLQEEQVRTKRLRNDLSAALASRADLALDIAARGDDASAALYALAFPPPPETP